jgi:two-component system, NarL family, sensor histidine kinase UhpB
MRWIQFTARARHVAERVVWDGIASDITAEKRAERALRASREELRELASYFARVREEERTSVARELHDDVGSTLTGIKFQLAAIRTKLTQDDALGARVAHLDDLVDGVIGSTSRLMHDLRPGILDEGIVAALEWQARTFEQRTGLPCEFAASHEDIALPPEAAMAAFRICQEALNNVVKHAAAASVEVQLCRRGDALTLTIADDGIGIDEEARRKPGHFGLRGMRERALAFGGTVDVARPAEGGTAITLTLPLASEPLPAGAQEVLP